MKYLKIQNNGELDIRLVALMGGTTKSNDKFKIGRFGTGLKYTLAYLYRNNIAFKCFSGETEVKIHTEQELIGDTTFEIICINYNRTSITTQMGQDWTGWMIIRELWCNALDEGGESKKVVYLSDEEKATGEAGKTSFYIQLTPEIEEILNQWHTYFIHGTTPLFETSDYAIYPSDKMENLKLYKQGVLIYQHPTAKAVFNYDIKGASINELREFKGIISMEILNALKSPNTEVINYFFKNVSEDYYEGSDMDYDWYQTFGEVWRNAIGSQRIVSYDTVREVEQNGIDPEAIKGAIQLPKKVYAALTKAFEGVGALRMADRETEFYEAKDIRVVEKIDSVLSLMKNCGYEISSNLKFCYGLFAKKDNIVALNRKDKEIMVSQVILNSSDEEIAALLIKHNEMFIENCTSDHQDYKNKILKLFTSNLLSKSSLPTI